MVKPFLRKIFAYLSFYAPKFFTLLEERIKFGVLRLNVKFNVVKESTNLDGNVCIFALYPSVDSINNVKHAIGVLIKNNYRVLVVLNRNKHSKLFEKELNDVECSLLVRENIGRDFGAYKTGFTYLERHKFLNDISQLLFINDSVIFPGNFNKLIKSTLDKDFDFGTAFLNYNYHLHAQSFFVWFSNQIICSNFFSDFWRSYRPLSHRKYAIKNGEVKLTSTMITNGFTPKPLLNATTLNHILKNRRFRKSWLQQAWGQYGIDFKQILVLKNEFHLLQFHRCLVETNPSHKLGLVATECLGFPLKKDLFKSGNATLGDITSCLARTGLDSKNLQCIELSLIPQGSNTTVTSLERIQRGYGLY